GLELIERRVEARVAVVDQLQQRAQDERVRGRLVKHGAEALEHGADAGDRPRIEQRQQELGIVGLELLEILDGAHLMTDDDAEIPERVERAVDEPLLARADAAAEQQQQIAGGVKTEVTAPIAAERAAGNRPLARAG